MIFGLVFCVILLFCYVLFGLVSSDSPAFCHITVNNITHLYATSFSFDTCNVKKIKKIEVIIQTGLF